jgi:glycosyltransferase involved in cell wall biosynthesis
LKILISTFTYPPHANGVAEASAVLARGLAARGHSVTVATAYHPDRKSGEPNQNPRIEQFNIAGNDIRNATKEELRRYQQFVENLDSDVMFFECWDSWNTLLMRRHLHGVKARKVLVSHGYAAHVWVPYPRFAWGVGSWIRRMPEVLALPFELRRYDHVVFLSQRAAWDRFLDHWVAKATGLKSCSVIPNGAFTREFANSSVNFRKDFGIDGGPLLLCVANYCDNKNQMMALRAFRNARLENATLVFIGSEFNNYSAALQQLDEQLKRELNVGRVVLLQKISRELICAAYREADLFVLSAKAETQPIVLLEAMASKTPWISTDVGCVTELPGGVVARSESELAGQMKALLGCPERLKQLSEQGWAASQQIYDWERVVDTYENLLQRLAKHPPTGTAKAPENLAVASK